MVDNTMTTFIQIINPLNKPVRLSATTPIASASIVDPNTVFSLDTPTTAQKQKTNSYAKESLHFDLQHTSLSFSQSEKDILISSLA